MDKKFLIIAPYQFGELSDCYYWAKYATLEDWRITYIGYRYNHREIKERTYPGVKVKSVKHYSNRGLLGIVFYIKCIFEIVFHAHKNVIICCMPMCQILPMLFPKRNIILDIRTLSVSKDPCERARHNSAIKIQRKYFKRSTVISDGVGMAIGSPYKVLPLGAESLSSTDKTFEKMHLFYIGTFDNRNLSVFLLGMAKYQKEIDQDVTFDIVGGGMSYETESILNVIQSCGVNNVKMHGYLTHDEALQFFDKCNIGVCYVPITEYYQDQPPTKLYEYLLSGMAVISTGTRSNRLVMNDANGVVINDSADSVYEGLCLLRSKMSILNSRNIVSQSQRYTWQEIVTHNLLPILQ